MSFIKKNDPTLKNVAKLAKQNKKHHFKYKLKATWQKTRKRMDQLLGNDDYTKMKKQSFNMHKSLLAFKAKEAYVFASDYIKIDDYYATILTFRAKSGSQDDYHVFWGVNMIPRNMPDGVTSINFDQVHKVSEAWLTKHNHTAEKVMTGNLKSEQEINAIAGSDKAVHKINDISQISEELTSGAVYLNVQMRLLLKAPSLEKLDLALDRLRDQYREAFGTLKPAAFQGRQREEMSHLLAYNEKKHGKGLYFTSKMYAGQYDLVTHGIEDDGGEYVGKMSNDINEAAILFDIDGFHHHTVVGSEQLDPAALKEHYRVPVPDVWGLKICQSALLNNHRVVEIVLSDGSDFNKVAPALSNITTTIDMSRGDINMFEVFGKHKDVKMLFPRQVEKLVLMFNELYYMDNTSKIGKTDSAIMNGSLRQIIIDFYKQKGMWFDNIDDHLDDVRLVGLPHNQYPLLNQFDLELNNEYDALKNQGNRDDNTFNAVTVLKNIFDNLLAANSTLFDHYTRDNVDGIIYGRRVVYNFGSLLQIGSGVAMAELVNVIDYAVSDLQAGDVVIIHGAENLDKSIWQFCQQQFDMLYRRGGRVVFLYNNIDKLFDSKSFNHFDNADYTIFGTMTNSQVRTYGELMNSSLPDALINSLTQRNNNKLNFIHRDTTNVVFDAQLLLRPTPEDYGKQERVHYV